MKDFGFESKDKFSYNINALEDIGWIDKFRETPLPMKMVKPKTLVYHKSRFEEDYIPRIVFVPSFKVMFTIMRHCIGVQSVDDLWFVLEKAELPIVDKDIVPHLNNNDLPPTEEKDVITEPGV